MAISLVLFDLDGVLIDAKEIHYQALNAALGRKYAISRDEHIRFYDGKKTFEKLNLLTKHKGLPESAHAAIWNQKQALTTRYLSQLKPIPHIVELFRWLTREKGIKIGVCSNSIRDTLDVALDESGLFPYVSLIVSNQDVQLAKPHPEMYWRAMTKMGALPEETLIVEDSPMGLLAAQRSGANWVRVRDTSETTIDTIMPHLHDDTSKPSPKWKDENLNVLIPMAGAGSRFAQAGYTFPKPLIEVAGKPMIQLVVENLSLDANYIFVVQAEHRRKYNLDSVLRLIAPNCKIVETNGLTEGAACTALLAREHINNDHPLVFANSDQFMEWDVSAFMYEMQERRVDGGILTFNSTHPKWSYAKVEGGVVTEVAEKNPISNHATVGVYYWRHGSDFVRYAERMIESNKRVNNEFYVCPVFNEAIVAGKTVIAHEIERMWGLGTPEDLREFLENHKPYGC